MFTGRGFWRRIPLADRHLAMSDALALVQGAHRSVALFGVAVDPALYEGDVIADAFECLASSFDRALVHMHVRLNSQRDLIVFDKHKKRRSDTILGARFQGAWSSLGRAAQPGGGAGISRFTSVSFDSNRRPDRVFHETPLSECRQSLFRYHSTTLLS